jgi:hypothetical protein
VKGGRGRESGREREGEGEEIMGLLGMGMGKKGKLPGHFDIT